VYHEFRSTNRETWKFTYHGQELLEPARARRAEYAEKERAARERVSALMLDKTVGAKDERITNAQGDVERYGAIHEQLMVWCHEFARAPDREFMLSLGDVVFFGLIGETNG
jgi:hypothetical protein